MDGITIVLIIFVIVVVLISIGVIWSAYEDGSLQRDDNAKHSDKTHLDGRS